VFGQERDTVDEAFPGDIVALVNAAEVRVGDTL
jgi:peptide chain release factor 3